MLCCSLFAAGLSFSVLSAFVISSELTSDILLVTAVAFIASVVLFLISSDRKTAKVLWTAGAAILVIAIIYMLREGMLKEGNSAENSRMLFYVLIVLSSVFTFIFTRKKVLCLIFSSVSLAICGIFDFFEFPVSLYGLIIMTIGILGECMLRSYEKNIEDAAYGTVDMKRYVLQSMALILAVILGSALIYGGLVKRLDPPTADLKLITEYLSWDVVDKKGVSSSMETESKDMRSDDLNDEQHKTNKKDDLDSEDSDTKSDAEDEESKNDEMRKKSKNSRSAFSVSYDELLRTMLTAVLVVLALLLIPFIAKIISRIIRRKKIEAMEPSVGCMWLYSFFLDKLKYLGIERPKEYTLKEYVKAYKRELRHFTTPSGVNFEKLTDIYSKALYGAAVPGKEDLESFIDFYDHFIPTMKERLGKAAYMYRFWSI